MWMKSTEPRALTKEHRPKGPPARREGEPPAREALEVAPVGIQGEGRAAAPLALVPERRAKARVWTCRVQQPIRGGAWWRR